MIRLASAFFFIFAITSSVWAIDYEKIDRTIVKEPKHKTDSPRYTLLLFGPEAKLKVWLVFDGDDTYYLDRNLDGDLTGANECFDDPAKNEWLGDDVKIADPDGKTTYFIQSVSNYKQHQPPGRHAVVQVKIAGPVNYREYCTAYLWDDPKKTSVAHFHGPLVAGPSTSDWKISPYVRFIADEKPFRFDAEVSTSDEKHQCRVVVCSDAGDDEQSYAFPGRLMTVDVEFPPKDSSKPRIKARYTLDEHCCGSVFKGTIKVPAEVGLGKAKATFSFDALPEGKVKPTTVELPVVSAEQAHEADKKAAGK